MTQLAQADGPLPADPAFLEEVLRLQAALCGDLFKLRRLVEAGIGQTKLNHDLRNTLSAALMLSDRLSESDDAGVQRAARMIGLALDQAQALLAGAATFSSEAAPRLAFARIPLAPLLTEAHAEVSGRFPDLTLVNTIATDLDVMADATALAGVFRRLMETAARAQAKRLEAEADTDTAQRMLRIRLRDDGYAFRPDQRAQAFTLCGGGFRHGSQSYGLVAARDIVEALGGRILLADTAALTCIEIWLPA